MELRRTAVAFITSAAVLLLAKLLLAPAVFASTPGAGPEQLLPTPTPIILPAELAYPIGGSQPIGAGFLPARVENPTVTPAWIENVRRLTLTMLGFQENANIVVNAQNERGETFSKRITVGPPEEAQDAQGQYTVTVAGAHLLWPGSAAGGTWHITVAADGVVYDQMHEIPAAVLRNDRLVTLTPRSFRDPLRVSTDDSVYCSWAYAYYPGEQMTIAGTGYTANADAELGLYRTRQSDAAQYAAERINHFQSRTDNEGRFVVDYKIPEETAPGAYWMVALTDPAAELAIGDARTRCFRVEAPPNPLPELQPADRVQPSTAVVLRNANLRAGPGVNFARIGTVPAGKQINVVGTNPAGTWYQLDAGSWIAAFLVRLEK